MLKINVVLKCIHNYMEASEVMVLKGNQALKQLFLAVDLHK